MTRLDTTIVEVTVSPTHAWVTRRGQHTLTPGENLLVLESLPPTLDPQSVRAKIANLSGVKIQNIEVIAQGPLTEMDAQKVRNQLDQLSEEDQALADADAAQVERLKFLKKLRKASTDDLSHAMVEGTAGFDQIGAFSRYLVDELNATYAARRDIARQRRVLEQQMKPLEDKLNPSLPANDGPRFRPFGQRPISTTPYTARIMVIAESAVALAEISFIYKVSQVSWEAAYDIRLVDEKLVVTYLAQIRQASGEDWPAVPMAFTTARPLQQATLPQLSPWYVDEFQPPAPPAPPAPPRSFLPRPPDPEPPPSPFGSLPSDRKPLNSPFGRKEEDQNPPRLGRSPFSRDQVPPNPDAISEQAALELTGTSPVVNYAAMKTSAVKSDNQPQRAVLGTFELSALMDYVTVPRLANSVCLRAKVTNTSGFVWLAGTASIFHGGDFIGKTQLKMTAADEDAVFVLGVDEGVTVQREMTERSASTSLIGNIRRTIFSYKITLTNRLPAPTIVTVTDQVPISRHEDIGVRVKEVQPKPDEQSEQNVLQWKIELGPHETQELILSFTIDHPREMRITGIL